MSAPSRNGPCPCGSGVKYKKCCLPKDEAARAAHDPRGRVVNHRGRSLAVSGDLRPEAFDMAVDLFDQNEAGEGFAAQIMRFSQPLIGAAGDDPESVQRAMTLGMIFWNMAIMGEGAEAMLAGVLKDLALTEEQAAEFRALAVDMVARHVEMFPELHQEGRERCASTEG